MTVINERAAEGPHSAAPHRSRAARVVSAATVVALSVGIVCSTGGTASAAAKPKAQAVGRFLDGTAGGNAIQQLADLVDARAKAAPDTTDRNPLEAKALGQLDAPLGDALQLPGGGALTLGAANQLAVAKSDGASLGASGAVLNSGGTSLGGNDTAYPANAKLDLTAAALGSVPVPSLPSIPGLPAIPGLPTSGTTNLSALGGITGSIGAVAGLVQTKSGGKIITPSSGVASLKLNIGSPALGALLSQLKALLDPSTLTGLLGSLGSASSLTSLLDSLSGGQAGTVTGILKGVPVLGGILGGVTGGVTGGTPGVGTSPTVNKACALTAPMPTAISFDGGAVTVDPTTATISIDVGKLIKAALGKDISNLDTSNFDVVDFLVQNLPKILSTGLEGIINGITGPLTDQFTACLGTLNSIPGISAVAGLLTQLSSLLTAGQTQLEDAINQVAAPLTAASSSPLTQLASGLKNALDIGLNVQSGPGIQKHDTQYPFTSELQATPDQATPVVDKQTLVRAIEIDLLPAAAAVGPGAGSLPGLPSLPGIPAFRSNVQSAQQIAGAPAAAPAAAAPAASGVAVLALGNAAAGPSTLTKPTTTAPAPTTTVPATAVPTGVPAGLAGHNGGGSPALPIALVLLGLVLAGGGVMSFRMRGRLNH